MVLSLIYAGGGGVGIMAMFANSHMLQKHFRKSCKPENGSMCGISHLKQSHLSSVRNTVENLGTAYPKEIYLTI